MLLSRSIEMLCQSFEFRGRQAHLPLIAFGRPWRIACLLILAIPHIPVVEEHLIEDWLLFMLAQQAAFECVIKIFPARYVNIIQRLSQVQCLARPYIDAHLPENAAKFCQAIEQALPTLKLNWSQRLSGKVISILLLYI